MSGLDDFIAAISSQESGGSYRAVNSSTGALGRYQILPGNVTPWARQYLGIRMTPAQFMANPALQDQLARAVLGSYVKNYGYRGAAAAWYSGNPKLENSYTPQGSYPSIGSYVDSIIRKMGDQPLTQAMTRSALTAAAPVDPITTVDPEKTRNDIMQASFGSSPAPMGLSLGTGDGLSLNPQGADQLGLQIGEGLEAPVQSGLASPTGTSQAAPSAPSSVPASAAYGTQDKLRLAALEMAKKYLGTPYVYGGTGQGGIDCSALIWRALQSVGISIPRTGRAQRSMGQAVPMDKLQPGDLVAFEGGNHVALYIGNNQVIEAARPGTNVMIRGLGMAWDKANNMQGISFANLYK
jgi:cell wall-associated NlpC family hydrolase